MAGTIKHEWSGTVLTITSDSGTSSADLKGEKGDDGARGPQGKACSVATDTTHLGGIAAAEYALTADIKEELEKLTTYAVNYTDNPNFAINQRGKETYTATGYSIDRWRFRSSNGGTMEVLENGVKINLGTSGICGLYQIIASKDYNKKFLELAGKPITLAIKVKENTITATGNSGIDLLCNNGTTTEGNEAVVIARKGIPNGTTGIIVANGTMPQTMENNYINALLRTPSTSTTGSITVEWIKLYIGTYTADNLPQTIYKGTAAELLECQRYYYRTTGQGYGYATNANAARLNIPLPIQMRIVPSIEDDEGIAPTSFTVHCGGTNSTATSHTIAEMIGNTIRLNLVSDGKYTKFTAIGGYASNPFGFSADL